VAIREDSSPLVSLVMAAWRPRRDWFEQAVAAALGQRHCDIELVVVDDGSPEPVAELLSGLEDGRCRVVRVPHGGEPAARNAGIAASRGQFLRFIDADDVIEASSTARLLELVGGRADLIGYGATMFCDAELRPIWKMTCGLEGDVVEDCLLGRFTVRPHALLFPRRIVEATGDWDGGFTVSHDWDFCLRAVERAPVRGTAAVVTCYRRHGEAATADPDAGVAGADRVLKRYFDRHPERVGTPFERRARAYNAALAARVYLTHRSPRKGLARLVGAARLDPRAIGTEIVLGLRVARSRARYALGHRGSSMAPGQPLDA
jgi:glycosyltransferase involved in cell wall biosynthesis